MPKRHRSDDDDYEHVRKKLKKLERKLRRRRKKRSRHRSERTDSEAESPSPGTPMRLSDTEDGPLLINDESPVTMPVEQNEEAPVPGLEQLAPDISDMQDILEILGADPTQDNTYGKEINKDVALRFEHCATTGLTKDARKELTDKYHIPENCKMTIAPALNLEMKAAISDELTLKRDKAIEAKQNLLSLAITSLGEAITMVLTSDKKNNDLLRLLMDTGRILCDCQYGDSLTRRTFVLSALKKEMKEQIQNTKVDELLFGQNLAETLKVARNVNKSGAELKPQTTPRPTGTRPLSSVTNQKNWKSPAPYRRQPYRQPQPGTSQRTMKPAATRGRPQPSSRPLLQHQRPPFSHHR